jgi:hypothetical protein
MKDLNQLSDAELDEMIVQQSMAQPQNIDFSSMSDEQLDQMIIERSIPQASQGRPGESFLQNFANSAAMGYLPQIQAALEPAVQGVAGMFGDNVDEELQAKGFTVENSPDKSYVERRDQYINDLNQLSAENPKSALAGNIAGAITGGIGTGGAIAKAVGSVTKVASGYKRLGDAAKAGAVVGFGRNPGDTEGEVSPLQLKERALNAAQDAATGLLVQGGLEGIKKAGEGIKGAGKNLESWSQRKALKAAGAEKTQFKKQILNKSDKRLGQSVLDNELIKPGDDVRDIAKNAESALKKSGEKIGEVYKKADDVASLGKGEIKNIADEYSSEAAERLQGTVDGDQVAEKLQKVIDTIPENATFGQLRKWRASIDDQINFSKANQDLPKYQEELLALRNKVQERIAEKIGKSHPELKKTLLRENKRFSELSEVKKLADQKSAGVEANTGFGIREGFGATLGGMAGSAVLGPMGTAPGIAIGALTTNVLRKHATPFMAMTANKVAKALEKNQSALGKFSKPLIEAAKSPEKFAATVNMMMKDPEFKKSLNQMGQSEPVYRGPARGRQK